MILERLSVPIVLAPLAGGSSTPELTAAVSNAGGLGFLAAGYLTASALKERLDQARALTGAPLGVNVFVPGRPGDLAAVQAYAATLAEDARGAALAWARPATRTMTGPPRSICSPRSGCPSFPSRSAARTAR